VLQQKVILGFVGHICHGGPPSIVSALIISVH
jgi:hypothetical protein